MFHIVIDHLAITEVHHVYALGWGDKGRQQCAIARGESRDELLDQLGSAWIVTECRGQGWYDGLCGWGSDCQRGNGSECSGKGGCRLGRARWQRGWRRSLVHGN